MTFIRSQMPLLVLLAAASALLSQHGVLAWGGIVHLFADANFGTTNGHWMFGFSLPQYCINAASLNDSASSAQWWGLGKTGSLAKIAFYTGADCTGTVRAWSTEERDFPTNFAKNGIDNQISSFMVWENSTTIGGIAPTTSSTSN